MDAEPPAPAVSPPAPLEYAVAAAPEPSPPPESTPPPVASPPPPDTSPPLPPPLDLGPLPPDLVEVVLLLLSPVERVMAERVSKGWLNLLREPRLWRELNLDTAEVDLANHGIEGVEAIHFLAKHAGASLRSIRSSIQEPTVSHELGDVLKQYCPNVKMMSLPLCLSEAGDDPQSVPADYLFKAALPALSTCEMGSTVVLVAFAQEELTGILAKNIPTCVSTLVLKYLFEEELEEEDGAIVDGASRLLRVAAELCACNWKQVTVEVAEVTDDIDSVVLCTALRGFVEGLATAPPSVQLVIKEAMGADEARWVTRAVPAHLRINWLQIYCDPTDAHFLGEAFHPTAVVSGSLWLCGPAWSDINVISARGAMAACARENAKAGRASLFELKLACEDDEDDDDEPWSDAARDELASWLRGSSNIVKLEIATAADQLVPFLLPALPECLQELRISGAYTPATFELAMDALESRPLPALKELIVFLPSEGGDSARRLLAALAAQPRDGLSVSYWLADPYSSTAAALATHLTFFAPLPCVIGYITSAKGVCGRRDAAQALTAFFSGREADPIDAVCRPFVEAGALPILISALHAAASSSGATLYSPTFLRLPPVADVAHLLRLLLLSPAAFEAAGLSSLEHRAPLIRSLFRLLLTERAGVLICSQYVDVCPLLRQLLTALPPPFRTLEMPSLALQCLAAYHRLPRSPSGSGLSEEDEKLNAWLSLLRCSKSAAAHAAVRQALAAHHAASPSRLLRLGLLLAHMLGEVKASLPALSPLESTLNQHFSWPELDITEAAKHFADSFALCPAVLGLTSVRVALHSLLDDCRNGGSLLRSQQAFSIVCILLCGAKLASGGALSFGREIEAAQKHATALQRLGADASSPARMCAEHPQHHLGRVKHADKWPHMLRKARRPGVLSYCATCDKSDVMMVTGEESPGAVDAHVWRCAAGCSFEMCRACVEARYTRRSHQKHEYQLFY